MKNKTGPKPKPIAERLWRSVTKTQGCWLWTGRDNGHGYGTLGVKVGDKWGVVYVHRLSYELHKGQIPEGLQIDHICNTRNCVNPEHLRVVTARENTLRSNSVSAIAARKTHCRHGHPFSGDNLRITSGKRRCYTCLLGNQRRYDKAKAQRREAPC